MTHFLTNNAFIDWDIICGVSVGAINGSYMAKFPMGQHETAAKGLKELWLSISNDKVGVFF